ncbi:unnamed protein product, partial [Trichogramma brassicae]
MKILGLYISSANPAAQSDIKCRELCVVRVLRPCIQGLDTVVGHLLSLRWFGLQAIYAKYISAAAAVAAAEQRTSSR